MQVTAKIDQGTQRRFNALLKEMHQTTNKEMYIVMRNALRDLCFEAMKLTPRAPKKKPLREMKVKGQGGKYWVKTKHRHTGRRVVFIGTKQQMKQYGKPAAGDEITGRSYTKACWLKCLQMLGKKLNNTPPNYTAKNAHVLVGKVADHMTALAQNSAPWIEDMDNGKNKNKTPLHILERAMQNVNARMEQSLDRMADKVAHKARFFK